jgi:hypothetical protein
MTKKYESSAHERRRRPNGTSTKKARRRPSDALRPEYDFAALSGGVRGKHAQRVRESSNIVLLEPDIARAFPNEDAVNSALRNLLGKSTPKRRNP